MYHGTTFSRLDDLPSRFYPPACLRATGNAKQIVYMSDARFDNADNIEDQAIRMLRQRAYLLFQELLFLAPTRMLPERNPNLR
jgi:hypothetical protein